MNPMNIILANSCPLSVVEEGDSEAMGVGQVAEYVLETHCVTWIVRAKLTDVTRKPGAPDYNYSYDVISMVRED